jgi:NAD+ synthase (glutamine-hydrolysing)
MDFYSAYRQGFVRVAACTHHTTIADPVANADSVLRLARDCHDDSVALAVFPELTLSGYSIEDILLQDALLDAVEDALLDVVVASAEVMPVLVVGAPLRYQHRIYNTAVVIHRGRVLGVVPKSYLPTYREFYERRQVTDLAWDGQTMIWENGVLLAQSERFPKGERRSIADVDLELLRSERLRMGTFDDNRIHHGIAAESFRRVEFQLDPPSGDIGLRREVERFPFVPSDQTRLQQDCYEAYNIQVSGLEQRLRALNFPKVVIGVSGGLDSTHALIVAARAMDREGRPRSDILAFTMPGFATGERTKGNAARLAEALGVTFEELPIKSTAELMLKEIGHPFSRGERVYDVTFENVQAGLRTDYLFRLANQRGGIVLGTGDLSELALGWSTYGVGDQMSHYNVNGGVPKTLIQHLIRWVISSRQFDPAVNEVLQSVLDTEITPELVPTGEDEEIQSSEATVGPYVLQDFSLFHVLRYGFRPSKVAFLAWHAWRDADRGDWPTGFPEDKRPAYSLKEIRHWLQVFAQRFYSFSQFKRSALPNGPKVSHGGSLSPRGDWRAPSDMSARTWLDEIEREVPED